MTSPYPALFSGVTLHGKTLKNRIAHASMTTKMGVDQRVSEALLNYHRNRALGGAGMIVTEPVAVQPWHLETYRVNVFGKHAKDDLARWAACVEEHDCRLLGQLQDSGRGRHESGKHPHAIGPSALPDDLSWVVPKAMRDDEIEALIDRFVDAAVAMQNAGFSGVEISAAHGHLFHQFLSPWSNQRDDRWGGSLENRTRLLRLLCERIRDACGTTFIVGVKLPGDDGIPGSIDAVAARALTEALADPGVVSYLCHAQGSHSQSLSMHLPDMFGPRLPFVDLVRQFKTAAGSVPLMALGLITDPAEADKILASGDSELIGLGRPLVADPAWPKKSAEGRAADIRYCVSCNSCWATIVRDGRAIACDNNPRVGFDTEVDWRPRKTDAAKHIAIVGSGVAGLECAWVAAKRGHQVTVLSASEQLGGNTWLQAQLPGGENLSSVYDYQLHAAHRFGVTIASGHTATLESIISLQPDCVVLATGSKMLWPRQFARELDEDEMIPDLRAVTRQLLAYSAKQGGAAVVFDMDHSFGTYMAAIRLSQLFDRVVLMTPRETFAQNESLVTRQVIYRQLNEQAVTLLPFHEPGDMSGLIDGMIGASNVYTGKTVNLTDVALVTYATPRKPNDELYEPLVAEGYDVKRLGDCDAPGILRDAVAAGHALGNEL